MKYLTCEIDHVKNPLYERLLNAWERSIRTNCPLSDYERKLLNPKDYPQCQHTKNSYLANSVKLNYWNDYIQNNEGNLCLIDGDTVVLKDVSDVFENKFDIAYTVRSKGTGIPINGGVLFVRINDTTRRFFQLWTEINNRMLRDRNFHLQWYRVYKGINQASFGYMLQRHRDKFKAMELPCAIYNACDKIDWIKINSETRILHVKSEMRIMCINGSYAPQYKNAYQAWKQFDV